MAPLAVKVAVVPEQIALLLATALTVGNGFTVINCWVLLLEQPRLLPWMLYVVVVVGLNTAPVLIDAPVFTKV